MLVLRQRKSQERLALKKKSSRLTPSWRPGEMQKLSETTILRDSESLFGSGSTPLENCLEPIWLYTF